MGITCVTSLSQVVRKKTYSRTPKGIQFGKHHNNLVCPNCGVHLDRKDVKVWHDEYNLGECPSCFSRVRFDPVNPRGPRGGREYYESKRVEQTTEMSPRINDLGDKIQSILGISDPLSYLKIEEISRFSHENPDIVFQLCRNKWPIGRPSKTFLTTRQKILEFLNG